VKRRPVLSFSQTRLVLSAALSLTLPVVASAQTLGDTVSWSVLAAENVKAGDRLTVTLQGAVQDGWHVYALKQLPSGPTPLRVSLDTADVAKVDGALTGSAPTKVLDRGFGVETQFYSRTFTVATPVRIGAKVAPGKQVIPVSVRFQTCNDQICQPPKTVRLSVPINVQARG
jgi:DsbC/DsbD-like thiol-disulfide interchange protein